MNKSDIVKLDFSKTHYFQKKTYNDMDHNIYKTGNKSSSVIDGGDLHAFKILIILSHTKCCSEGMLLLYLKSL